MDRLSVDSGSEGSAPSGNKLPERPGQAALIGRAFLPSIMGLIDCKEVFPFAFTEASGARL